MQASTFSRKLLALEQSQLKCPSSYQSKLYLLLVVVQFISTELKFALSDNILGFLSEKQVKVIVN